MTSDQIYRYMQAPEKLNQETLPLLKELILHYPAFEAGWILLLKNLKNLNDSSFEQELLNGALRIQDRRKLYLILNEKTVSAPESSETNDDSGEPDIYKLIFTPEYRLGESVKTDEPIEDIAGSIQQPSGKRTSLIEKFLEAQPKMPPVKEKEPNPPVENQKLTDEGNDDPVTETLATIYAQQGYYKKAVQIFEKLSLKYPEKSTYFAGHIEKIKNLMNN